MGSIKLAKTGFKLTPEGERALRVISAEAKPKAMPQFIEITFEDVYEKTQLKSTYKITDDKGLIIFTILLKSLDNKYATQDTFDLDDLPNLVGGYVKAEIKHVEVQSKTDPTKTLTFCNITKILGGIDDDEYNTYQGLLEKESQQELE